MKSKYYILIAVIIIAAIVYYYKYKQSKLSNNQHKPFGVIIPIDVIENNYHPIRTPEDHGRTPNDPRPGNDNSSQTGRNNGTRPGQGNNQR